MGEYGYDDVRTLAQTALAHDSQGYRREFVSLVQLAQSLSPQAAPAQIGRAEP
jgi:hypothetical protein